MSSLSQDLKRWAIEELDLPGARLPDDGYMKTLVGYKLQKEN